MRRLKGKGKSKFNQGNYGQFHDSKYSPLNGGYNSDQEVINEFVEQQTRTGNFERIFPLDFNVNYYSQFLERERNNNELLRNFIRS
jgi:hypothetical protein